MNGHIPGYGHVMMKCVDGVSGLVGWVSLETRILIGIYNFQATFKTMPPSLHKEHRDKI